MKQNKSKEKKLIAVRQIIEFTRASDDYVSGPRVALLT